MTPAEDYELLIHDLLKQLPLYSAVTTTRLDHDVDVPGLGTTNQIDVLWDFTDGAGQDHRVVFEAKWYGRAVDQSKLHVLRSVVADIDQPDRPVRGVMVTKTGYQSGAKSLAETYGLLILELREPVEADLAGRVAEIQISAVAQIPIVENVRFLANDVYDDEMTGVQHALGEILVVDPTDRETGSARQSLADLLGSSQSRV